METHPWDSSSRVDLNEDLIGSVTSVEAIVCSLAKRGCLDLTSSIDLAACSEFPCAGGGYSDVFRGALYGGTDIAIKTLRVYDRSEGNNRQKILKRAARELYHWSKLQHRNVLPLMGLAVFRGYISMISPWMKEGNLTAFLRFNPNVDRIKLCIDICVGLCYIHTNNMIHGDLKGSNVMITSDGTALIAGFGSARLKDITLQFTDTTAFGISIRWAAPELLLGYGSSSLSKEADVFAYGMTALETLTGEVPFKGISDRQVLHQVAFQRAIPPRPDIAMDDNLWNILKMCWAQEPAERPKMTSIKHRLLALYGMPSDIENPISGSVPSSSVSTGPRRPTLTDHQEPSPRSQVTISRTMSLEEVIACLCSAQCRDVTHELDNPSCQQMATRGGGYGDVYSGSLKNGSRVALKCLRMLADRVETVHQHAARELHVWSKLKHVNVLELLGLALFKDQIAMVSPWMDHSDLHSYLRSYPATDRCILCTQIAAGLEYMHDEGVVHGDVKPGNVLVSRDGIPKLADFGSATLTYDATIQVTATSTQGVTPRYAAPELMSHQKTKTKESDVYALGMTILAVISDKKPYPDYTDIMVLLSVAKGEKPQRPEESIPATSKLGDLLWELLLDMWDSAPEKRPKAKEVLDRINPITHNDLKPQSE